MKSLTVFGSVLLFTLTTVSGRERWLDYRDAPVVQAATDAPSTTPPVTCKQPGPKCGNDCKTLYLCIKDGDNWNTKEIYKCGDGTTCNEDSCSTTPSSQCSLKDTQFSCASIEGVYPDPADCRIFHYCVPEKGATELQHKPSSCTNNYIYNPRTTYCDLPPLSNGSCPIYVPVCKTPGQTGIITQNPSLYYICMTYAKANKDQSTILYPYLYLCPNGKKYNGKFDCV